MLPLTIPELRSVLAQAPLAPCLEPHHQHLDRFLCPVCLEYQPDRMVMHNQCSVLICAQDALALLDDSQQCPTCRGPISPTDALGPTRFIKILPIVQQFLDEIQFRCDSCQLIVTKTQAYEHHLSCPDAEPVRQPPENVPPRGLSRLVKNELVSNPVVEPQRTLRENRLLIYYYNGRQICTKMIPATYSGRQVRDQIAAIAGAERENLKIFKFIHREIASSDSVDDFAHTNGVTYISAYSDQNELSNRAAHLILHEIGPPPVLPRAQAEPQEVEEEWW